MLAKWLFLDQKYWLDPAHPSNSFGMEPKAPLQEFSIIVKIAVFWSPKDSVDKSNAGVHIPTFLGPEKCPVYVTCSAIALAPSSIS